ncbi:RNA polymerase sigma factor [Thiovibrio frasassiensis]|uniref:Sigma-70 family RNA polymerase sigma factor n=1 Tax=Thiovibrio frasassiensis TaxID=2984131 RepID=A0A9X4RL14_9BACT|nr:sigma-70 family RNA polymerase sigma factor [Thiovibrio frasassiensis]MDG4474593.1 sigma-70 family RNA polymerase sigma factor [Thiovibrio frasassiensis]
MPYQEVAELVRAFRQGEQQAFNRLVTLYQKKIYNLALGYVKQEDEAKDLAQDIFVTVFRQIDKLKDESKFGAWLYQLALNHCRNRYQKLRRRGFFSNQSLDDPDTGLHLSSGTTPEKEYEQQNTVRLVREAIASLAPAEKEVILLRDLQELSYEEISEILALPMGTVKSKLNRARLALKKRLKHHL